MKLNELKPAEGSQHRIKRVGRGDASGHGGTSTRGNKGQKSRSGGFHKRGFEGGQMPLQRRIPKRGFVNIFKKEYAIINLGQLNSFLQGTEVTLELLAEKGLIKRLDAGLKILSGGELEHPVTVKGVKISRQARAKLEAAGGKVI